MIDIKPVNEGRASAAVASLSKRKLHTLDELGFYYTLTESSGISLIFFTTPSCSSCKAWRELLQRYARRQDEITLFEVNAEESSALTNEYDVFHLPALFLFIDGDYHCELQCEADFDKLSATIQTALAAPAEDSP